MSTATLANQPPGPDAGPASPTGLSRQALARALRKTFTEFDRDNAWDWAAALTYYGVLSIFPGLVVIVSLVGLIGRRPLQPLIDSIAQVAPGPVRDIINTSVTGLQSSSGKAGIVAAFGLVVALWSASGYVGAFMRAANAMYDVPEGRPIWKTMPIRLAVTAVTGVLLVASATIVVVSGNLATAIGRGLGLERATIQIWSIAKWPVLIVLVGLMFAILYWASPNARQGGFRWVSPGGALAVLLWVVASVLFGVYAANFGSYDKTYGTLAGAVVLLVWLWISNLAILLGAELDAELERQRAIAAGMPPSEEPYMQLRDGRAVDPAKAEEPGLGDRATAASPSAPRKEPAPSKDGPRISGAVTWVAGAALVGLVWWASRRRR